MTRGVDKASIRPHLGHAGQSSSAWAYLVSYSGPLEPALGLPDSATTHTGRYTTPRPSGKLHPQAVGGADGRYGGSPEGPTVTRTMPPFGTRSPGRGSGVVTCRSGCWARLQEPARLAAEATILPGILSRGALRARRPRSRAGACRGRGCQVRRRVPMPGLRRWRARVRPAPGRARSWRLLRSTV